MIGRRASRRVPSAVIAAGLALGGFAVLAPAASAGDTSRTPDGFLRVKQVWLDSYTGNVIVRARVECTGTGTMTWSAAATQSLNQTVSAAAVADVPCDGIRRRDRLVLDPADGRFVRGAAAVNVGYVTCGAKACTASGQNFDVTL